MKQLLVGFLAALLVTACGVTASADVNDFSISRYDITYELSKDAEGRSLLRTSESITAQFPNYDQNHGLERAIPKSYDGHSTSLKIESVKKPDGSNWNYSTYESNGNEVLRIGDADSYVQGSQTFMLTYTQRDVTRLFSDTKSDEFYWDTNGTEWRVPIENLNITLNIDKSLTSKLNGITACYEGAAGSTNTCNVSGENGSYVTSATNVAVGENVTLAVGFQPNTFSEYKPSLFERFASIWVIGLFITLAVSIVIMIGLAVRWATWSSRTKDKGTIIPEYIPPADTSITTAASTLTTSTAGFTAQLLDFAVRHYIKIIQTREKSLWKSAEYEIEIIKDISSLKAEEQEILSDIFAGSTAVGTKLDLKSLKNNTALYTRTRDNDKKLKSLVRGEYGLRQRDPKKTKWFYTAGFVLLGLSVVLLCPPLLLASIVAFICGATLWPLTDKGLELSRYLDGLKEYIKVAETERLNMLQSPEGAAKVPDVNTNDSAQLVKLYERVLPYAVLFGQEKEWSKRIGDIYETNGTRPEWYSGTNSTFNAAAFSSAVSGFNSAASYSSASSSTSGGSSGGGSSGGGGGGGGGGGW